MDPFESLLGVDYEPWIRLLPASLEQCAVCGFRTVRTFHFWPNGPVPTEADCHACGYEYGGRTFMEGLTFEMHRAKWQSEGCRWWCSFGKRRQPDDWDPKMNFDHLVYEVKRAANVPLSERAPELLEHYLQCIDHTIPTAGSDTERTLLARARGLLRDAPIIGGGSNKTAYRFGTQKVAHGFLLLQPDQGEAIPPFPVQLNLSATGDPISITNIRDKRYTEITPDQLSNLLKGLKHKEPS